MQKAKKYDWKDSNMALFGSDTEKKVKKESAESEEAWHGSGQDVGLKIWRIVKFKVTHWPIEDYGKFFSGDSYIILNTYKDPEGDELMYDVHFWIGKYSTQDEYETAAYKTVELDTYHDEKPVQHREVQFHESDLFKSYFQTVSYLKGGADTGFKRELPESCTPRLIRVNKDENKKLNTTEVLRKKSTVLDGSGDVFILDLGLTLYQWNGKDCSHDEKFKASQYIAQIKSERGGTVRIETLEEESTSEDHPCFKWFDQEDEEDEEPDQEAEDCSILKRVSDEDGSLDMEDVTEGEDISRHLLSSEDVFIIDVRSHVFVWVGKQSSIDERKNGLSYAHSYLRKTSHPWKPVSVVQEGKESQSKAFVSAVAGYA